MDDVDREFARAAIEAAAEGEGLASPNPLVGSVVVRDGKVVGRGFHVYDNRKHGEVVALERAGELARGATVYVNLEPCCHFGRTPPCVDALIEAGVARVVASMQDPAPYVNGGGFERLREAGIDVVIGIEREAAEVQNERYLRYITTGRPFVHLKIAQTLDGRIATRTGSSKWITGQEARAVSQELRRRYDAILVGVNTVVQDDPDLTYRGEAPKRAPLTRVVVDPRLRMPLDRRLVLAAGASPVVSYCRDIDDEGRERLSDLRAKGVDVVSIPTSQAGGLDLEALLEDLGRRHVTSVLVEGGASTAGGFVSSGLVDKVTFFIAPRILGGAASLGSVGGPSPESLDSALQLERVATRQLGVDLEVTAYPRRG